MYRAFIHGNFVYTKPKLMAHSILHTADSRGHADHGWLRSYHTFSFAGYHNPERMHFGALRVLNDDRVAANRGFGAHPHNDMEIISIPLKGTLKHQDSMGNEGIIRPGEIQVMSAGTGVVHSEFNPSENEAVEFLQIWVIPNKMQVSPRYDQQKITYREETNTLQQVLSPHPEDAGVWIHQQAWFHMGKLDKGVDISYDLKDAKNGLYIFVLEGQIQIGSQVLNRRDAYGLEDITDLKINALETSEVLLMEVPMAF